MKMLRAKFLSRQVASLLASTQGNVAMTFAIATMPIILAVGATIDYTGANKVKTKLDALADAAALSAVAQSAMTDTPDQARKNAVAFFSGQTAGIPGANITAATATVTQQGSDRTAVFDYAASVRTSFMGIAGYNNITVKGSATASSASLTYTDFHLLLDNSPSMGIGATPEDVAAMENDPRINCAFACHAPWHNTYALTKTINIKTRFNTVAAAAQDLIDTAMTKQSGQIRMGVYSFGAVGGWSHNVEIVAGLSRDLNSVKSSAAKVDLMYLPDQGAKQASSDLGKMLRQMGDIIGSGGNGTSPNSPQTYVFFVSDGVTDGRLWGEDCYGVRWPAAENRCFEPVKMQDCDYIKKRNIKLAVFYTTYVPVYKDPDNINIYPRFIASMNQGPWGPSPNSLIAQQMKKCASDGLYLEVGPNDKISDAMKAMFFRIAQQARITK